MRDDVGADPVEVDFGIGFKTSGTARSGSGGNQDATYVEVDPPGASTLNQYVMKALLPIGPFGWVVRLPVAVVVSRGSVQTRGVSNYLAHAKEATGTIIH